MSAATLSLIADLKQLPIEDRLEIIDELWESSPAEDFPVTQEVIDEMNRRYDESVRHPETCRPWEEVRAELLRGK